MGEIITIPIHNNTYTVNTVKIPPRTEIIVPFRVNIEEGAVICKREISDGIFLANVIVPKDVNQHVRLLNVLDKAPVIRNLRIDTIPLRNYSIYKVGSNNTKYTKERFEKLINELNLENIDVRIRKELIKILEEYHLEGQNLTTNNFYSQTIRLQETSPVYIKNYHLLQAHTEEIDNQVQGLLRSKIIEPSISPYNAPLLLVSKKGQTDLKKWRLVVDFRKINDKIVNDKFPLTRLDDILDKLGRAK